MNGGEGGLLPDGSRDDAPVLVSGASPVASPDDSRAQDGEGTIESDLKRDGVPTSCFPHEEGHPRAETLMFRLIHTIPTSVE